MSKVVKALDMSNGSLKRRPMIVGLGEKGTASLAVNNTSYLCLIRTVSNYLIVSRGLRGTP